MSQTDNGDEVDDATGEGSSTLLNAIIGAVVGIVLSFIPLSPVFGGGVAGYLEGGSSEDGLRVGAIAGLLMIIPLLFFAMFFFVVVVGLAGRNAFFAFFGVIVVLFFIVYTVGLSLLGGYLGVYLKDEL